MEKNWQKDKIENWTIIGKKDKIKKWTKWTKLKNWQNRKIRQN